MEETAAADVEYLIIQFEFNISHNYNSTEGFKYSPHSEIKQIER